MERGQVNITFDDHSKLEICSSSTVCVNLLVTG